MSALATAQRAQRDQLAQLQATADGLLVQARELARRATALFEEARANRLQEEARRIPRAIVGEVRS